MDIYERLGVTKRVNGAGLLTRLGGSLMAPEILDAMREAAGSFVDMAELQTRASAIPFLTGVTWSFSASRNSAGAETIGAISAGL